MVVRSRLVRPLGTHPLGTHPDHTHNTADDLSEDCISSYLWTLGEYTYNELKVKNEPKSEGSFTICDRA